MRCNNCGNQMDENAACCPNCGAAALKTEAKKAKPVKAVIAAALIITVIAVVAVCCVVIGHKSPSEADYRNKLEGFTTKPIISVYCTDYNTDGTEEAFAVVGEGTEDSFTDAEIWFVSDKASEAVKTDISGSFNGILAENGRKYISVEVYEEDNNEGASYIYGVKAVDEYYEPEISGKYRKVHEENGKIVTADGVELSITDSESDSTEAADDGIKTNIIEENFSPNNYIEITDFDNFLDRAVASTYTTGSSFKIDSYKRLADGSYRFIVSGVLEGGPTKIEMIVGLEDVDGKQGWDLLKSFPIDIPADTIEFNGKMYYLYEESLSKEDASRKCYENGGALVSIDSEEEQKIITDYIKKKGCSKNIWTDMFCHNDGRVSYSEVFPGITVTLAYKNWADGYPSETPGFYDIAMCGSDEHNIADTGKWMNCNSDDKNYYICEWDAE